MRRVLDRLMLCQLSEANDPYFLKSHDVQAILFFGEGGMFPEDIKLYHRPVKAADHLSEEDLKDGVTFLRESLQRGRRILAVGETGATIVGAYLVEMGFSSAQALQMLGRSPGENVDERTVTSHEAEMKRRSKVTVHRGKL